jgi:hypothetical protein
MSALAMLAVSIVVSAPQAKLRLERDSVAATPRSTPYLRDNADSSSRRASSLGAGRAALVEGEGEVVAVAVAVVVVVMVMVVAGLEEVVVVVPDVTATVGDGLTAAGSSAHAAATPRGATVSRYRRVSMQAL